MRPARETSRQGIGRSRGGRTTKIHLHCNAWGLPMRADVTRGQTSDHKGFDLVMGDGLRAPGALLVDKGYDADHIRARAEARNAISPIPIPAATERSVLRAMQLGQALLREAQNIRRELRRPRLYPALDSTFCQHGPGD
nr:transposase [Jannaschia marina]